MAELLLNATWCSATSCTCARGGGAAHRRALLGRSQRAARLRPAAQEPHCTGHRLHVNESRTSTQERARRKVAALAATCQARPRAHSGKRPTAPACTSPRRCRRHLPCMPARHSRMRPHPQQRALGGAAPGPTCQALMPFPARAPSPLPHAPRKAAAVTATSPSPRPTATHTPPPHHRARPPPRPPHCPTATHAPPLNRPTAPPPRTLHRHARPTAPQPRTPHRPTARTSRRRSGVQLSPSALSCALKAFLRPSGEPCARGTHSTWHARTARPPACSVRSAPASHPAPPSLTGRWRHKGRGARVRASARDGHAATWAARRHACQGVRGDVQAQPGCKCSLVGCGAALGARPHASHVESCTSDALRRNGAAARGREQSKFRCQVRRLPPRARLRGVHLAAPQAAHVTNPSRRMRTLWCG